MTMKADDRLEVHVTVELRPMQSYDPTLIKVERTITVPAKEDDVDFEIREQAAEVARIAAGQTVDLQWPELPEPEPVEPFGPGLVEELKGKIRGGDNE